jgi:UDP-4-amino-4-deoxy-L-arabinose formyltransferase/UDP-glucuronic acid dehydrogenase (UDP-4-keto-hexauronic acid decarboxylating)
MKVAVLGRTQLLFASALELIKKGHEIVLIGTSKASPEYTKKAADFEELAASIGCAYFFSSKIGKKANVALIKKTKPDISVSINWVNIIPASIIELFRHGILNAHLGDLPRFRGNAVPNWAIINGESQIALTIHQMTEDLDSGPILMKKYIEINEKTYISDIYEFTEKNVPSMFAEILHLIETGKTKPIPQSDDPADSLRCFPRIPSDSELDWNLSAKQLCRVVRASAEPFAGAYSYLDLDKITIWRAHYETLPYPSVGIPGQVTRIDKQKGEVSILTGDGILVIEEVQLEDGERNHASDIVKSMRQRFGIRVTDQIHKLKKEIERLGQLVEKTDREKD